MRKVVIHSAGSYDKLKVEKHPIPAPGRGQVLVEVVATGVNYADVCVRMGLYKSAKEFVGWPITPGFEFSGKIIEVGEGVDESKLGTDVFGVSLFGAYASHVVVLEDQVYPLPEKMTHEEAAGFPAVFLTAYYGLFELAHPRQKQVVLIHSAAGGVGSALVQLAKLAGCGVVGVVGSSHKVDAVRELGADEVIDKSTQNLWERAKVISPEGYHIIFDANGVETLKQSYQHLATGGKLVVYGFHSMLPKSGGKPNWLKLAWDWFWTPSFDPLEMTSDNKSVLAFNLSFLFPQKELLSGFVRQLIEWIDEGKLKPPTVTTYPLEKVAEAHKAIESGTTIGKLVLTVDHATKHNNNNNNNRHTRSEKDEDEDEDEDERKETDREKED